MPLPAPDSPLELLVASERLARGRRGIVFPEQWKQGRGTFGGLVVAALVRAIEAELEDPARVLRSVTAELPGPTQPGEAELQVELLRAGSAVTTATCRLLQGGEVQAHSVAVFGKARAGDADTLHLAPPRPRSWRELEPIPVEPPLAPDFARFFEWRTEGPFPFSGEQVPHAQGWIRPKHPGSARDAAYVAACIDAWWPALYTRETAPRPMATIAFTLQLVSPLEGLDPQAPLFHRASEWVVRDGYGVEVRELWGEDGRLVALNPQTFAIIK